MKIKQYLVAWPLLSFLLLASVVVGNFLFTFFKQSNDASIAVPSYPMHDMLIGILSESIRALLTCYLYPQLNGFGKSAWHGIRFGLVVSGLIGSLWLIVGYGSFELKNPDAFFWSDTVILLIQGILSGLGLYFVFKNQVASQG